MATFVFEVNESFLKQGTHPITNRRGEASCRQIEAEGLDHDHITIICPKGERLEGYLYTNVSTYGPILL